MSSLFGNPRTIAILILLLVTFVVSLGGGALGNAFGGGFLASPIAHIQLPAESVTATPIFHGFNVTNTMVATWISILVLLAVSFFTCRRMEEVPRGLQNLLEAVLEFFLSLSERIAGPEKARRFFPLVVTIFLFIIVSNWLGILPGFGTIGRIEAVDEVVHHHEDADGEVHLEEITLQVFQGSGLVGILPMGSMENEISAAALDEEALKRYDQRAGVLVPFLRSANTEVNTTLAIALVAMFMVHFWGFKSLGFMGHMGKFINIKAGPIGLFVGLLEAISEVARIISFTFRLFGNIFAGEVLLVAMAFLLPLIGIIPFLGLELFVGMIQAFIFAILTLVFAAMATVGHESEGH